MPRLRADASPIYEAIGGRLRALRQRAGKTLAAAGRDLGISAQQLCKYELGDNRLPPDLTVKVASLYCVTTDFILLGEGGRDAA